MMMGAVLWAEENLMHKKIKQGPRHHGKADDSTTAAV
jgi:hypothetical protein